MLVLSFRTEDEAVLGNPHNPVCTVKVIRLKGDAVHLGFFAPKNFEVNRRRVADDKRKHGDRKAGAH